MLDNEGGGVKMYGPPGSQPLQRLLLKGLLKQQGGVRRGIGGPVGFDLQKVPLREPKLVPVTPPSSPKAGEPGPAPTFRKDLHNDWVKGMAKAVNSKLNIFFTLTFVLLIKAFASKIALS